MTSDIYGPNTARVAAFIENLRRATPEELSAVWDAAWDAARDAAWGAAWGAARDAARDAEWGAARVAARAACALVVEDLITPEQFRLLTEGYEAFLPEVLSEPSYVCALKTGKFIPSTGSLLLKRTAKKQEGLHGLVLPSNSWEVPCDGAIVSVGLGRVRDGVRETVEYTVGDHVFYARFTDEEIVIDDETFHLVKFENVHGVLRA